MEITEAVVVFDGRGITSKVARVSPTAMIVNADVVPAAGDKVTVFIDGVGKIDSRVTGICPPHIELAFLTDTQERWRQLHVLRNEMSAEPI
ncbi:MAG: hypothetical protein ACPGRZ_09985 [Alphaproteobacteria bacterium]